MKNQRADIQGLRALAVVLVVVFHLVPQSLPGGYIGVDVFFVISGFLITAHLLREAERTGTVKLSQFWARRMRRLLPAALLVLVVSAIAALLLMPRSLLIQNLNELGLAALYALNWGLAANSVDYLAAENVPSLAQHYWSLSVEEQFYLLWPLLVVLVVWGAARVSSISKRQALTIALSGVFVASLVYSVIETDRSQASAYFITTTRAWEFAVGGLVSMFPALRPNHRVAHFAVSWGAVAMIVGSAFRFDSETAFPGWIALIPVLGTAALLWVGESSSTWVPQYLATAGPVKYLGDISYSVYLWHWPLIVVFATIQGRDPGWKWMLALASATLILAALTYRYVEDPLRRGPGPLRLRVPTFGIMAAGMVAVCALTFLPAQLTTAAEERIRLESQSLADDPASCFGAYALLNGCDSPYAWTATVSPQVAAGDSYVATGIRSCDLVPTGPDLRADCLMSDPADATQTVALVGDSFANQLAEAIAEVGDAEGWRTHLYSYSGCTTFAPDGESHAAKTCYQWAEAMWSRVSSDVDIDMVLISVRTLDSAAGQVDRARAVIEGLVASGKRVVIIRNAPGLGVDAPLCVESESRDDACAAAVKSQDWLAPVAVDEGVGVLDVRRLLCPGGICHALVGGTVAYFDKWHLTTTFARTLVPWLTDQLSALASQ